MPSTPGGGEALRRGVVWHADPVDRPAAASAWGEVAGSMVGQVHPPQLGSERELCPPTTGYSSELMFIDLLDDFCNSRDQNTWNTFPVSGQKQYSVIEYQIIG